MLGLVQELLPPIADINSRLSHQVAPGSDENGQANVDGGSTTMQHYAVVESDHPYKPAAVSNFKVVFCKVKNKKITGSGWVGPGLTRNLFFGNLPKIAVNQY